LTGSRYNSLCHHSPSQFIRRGTKENDGNIFLPEKKPGEKCPVEPQLFGFWPFFKVVMKKHQRKTGEGFEGNHL